MDARIRNAAASDSSRQAGKVAVSNQFDRIQAEDERRKAYQSKQEEDYAREQAGNAADLTLSGVTDAGLGLAAGTLMLPGQITAIAEAAPVVGPLLTDTKNWLSDNLPAWANPSAVADHITNNLVSATTRMAAQKSHQESIAAEQDAIARGAEIGRAHV